MSNDEIARLRKEVADLKSQRINDEQPYWWKRAQNEGTWVAFVSIVTIDNEVQKIPLDPDPLPDVVDKLDIGDYVERPSDGLTLMRIR